MSNSHQVPSRARMKSTFTPTNILHALITHKPPLCCLCSGETTVEETVQLGDEISFDPEDSTATKMAVFEIISYVLRREDFMSTTVCISCFKSTMQAYKFIEMCEQANQKLQKLLDGITYCLDHLDENEIEKYNTLSLVTDSSTLQSMLLYNEERDLLTLEEYSDSEHTLTSPSIPLQMLKCKRSRCKKVQRKQKYSPTTLTGVECDTCGQCFATKIRLINHIKCSCYNYKKPNYRHCKTACKTRSDGKRRTPLIRELCTICGKTVVFLKQHQERHNDTRYQCKKCGKKWKLEYLYRKHIKNQTCAKPIYKNRSADKPYKCNICNTQYSFEHSLKYHMKTHSDNKDDYIECNWCKKRFTSESACKSHTTTHTKEKKFECTICGGKFVSKPTLTYHIRTHTGEKPYKCELCDETFLNASRRMRHMQFKHLPPQRPCPHCERMFKGKKDLDRHIKKHFDSKSRLFKVKKGNDEQETEK